MILVKNMKGFSLIEIMIVIAILGVLLSISIPVYKSYKVKALNQSCLYEAKGYSNYVHTLLNDEDDSSFPIAPIISACQTITDASQWRVIEGNIIANVKLPSTARIECNLSTGTPCIIIN